MERRKHKHPDTRTYRGHRGWAAAGHLLANCQPHKRSAHLVTTLDILSGHNGDAIGQSLAPHRGVPIWRAGIMEPRAKKVSRKKG